MPAVAACTGSRESKAFTLLLVGELALAAALARVREAFAWVGRLVACLVLPGAAPDDLDGALTGGAAPNMELAKPARCLSERRCMWLDEAPIASTWSPGLRRDVSARLSIALAMKSSESATSRSPSCSKSRTSSMSRSRRAKIF